MTQLYGYVPLRPQLPSLPTSPTDMPRWAKDIDSAIASYLWTILLRTGAFVISNIGSTTFGAAITVVTVSFDGVEKDTSYRVSLTPSWNAAIWVTSKSVTGFTLNASVAPGGAGGTVDWTLAR